MSLLVGDLLDNLGICDLHNDFLLRLLQALKLTNHIDTAGVEEITLISVWNSENKQQSPQDFNRYLVVRQMDSL